MSDASAIASVGASVQEIHVGERPDVFRPPDASAALASYRERLESDGVRGFIAEQGGSVVGYALTRVLPIEGNPQLRPAVMIELDEIGVVPAARRQGAGKALVDAVRVMAEEIGTDRLQLTVWEFNVDAQQFFAAQGLEPTMRRMTTRLR